MMTGMMMKASLLFVVVALVLDVPGVAADDDDDSKLDQMHGWLMWASTGFLLPLGAIFIRYSSSQGDPTAIPSPARARMLFYLHITLQCIGVVLATAGVAILLRTMGVESDDIHEKLGVPLFIIIIIMPFLGIIRPRKGTQLRPYWFFVHWLIGTAVILFGIMNCFTGISLFQSTVFPIPSLSIAFSVQVAVMGFLYFLQGKWSYILRQGPSETQHESKLPAGKTEDHEMGTGTPIPTGTPTYDLPEPEHERP